MHWLLGNEEWIKDKSPVPDYHLGGRVVPFRRLENSSEGPWEDEMKTTDLGLYSLGLGCLYSGVPGELARAQVSGCTWMVFGAGRSTPKTNYNVMGEESEPCGEKFKIPPKGP